MQEQQLLLRTRSEPKMPISQLVAHARGHVHVPVGVAGHQRRSEREKEVTEAMMSEVRGSDRHRELGKERRALQKQRGKEKRVQKLKRIAQSGGDELGRKPPVIQVDGRPTHDREECTHCRAADETTRG